MSERTREEELEFMLAGLWAHTLHHRCNCRGFCEGVLEATGGSWPTTSCTRGEFTLASRVATKALSPGWPDEWDEEFDNMMGELSK